MTVYRVTGMVLDDTGTGVAGRTVRMYRRDTGELLASGVSKAASSIYDANFGNVCLLLHGDGADASTTITDSSPDHRTVTNTANVTISTTNSMFGGSSIKFNGTAKFDVPNSTELAFGTGDYTLEMGFVMNAQVETLLDMHGADYFNVFFIYLNSSRAILYTNNTDQIISSTLTNGQYYHLAICRSGTNTKMFIDGTQAGSTFTGDSRDMIAPICRFGSTIGNTSYYNGYLDEIRFTKGYARYTGNFTAPSAAHPDAGGVMVLGQYELFTTYSGEVNVITLDDSGGTTYNDLILRTTTT